MKSIEAISTPPVLGDEGSFGPAGRRGDIFRYDQTNLTGMVRLKSIRNGGGQRSFFDESGNITRPGTPKVSESKQPETDSVGDYFEKIAPPPRKFPGTFVFGSSARDLVFLIQLRLYLPIAAKRQ